MSRPNEMDGNAPTLDRFHEVEIEKLFEAMISFQSLRVQLLTFFGTVNLAALSLALSAHKAGVIFIASILLLMAALVDMIMVSILARFYYRAYLLEARYAPNDSDTYLSLFFMDELGSKIKSIAQLPQENRNQALNLLPTKHLHISGFWIPVITSLAEMILAFFLISNFGWTYF